jgi:hypothetical protein
VNRFLLFALPVLACVLVPCAGCQAPADSTAGGTTAGAGSGGQEGPPGVQAVAEKLFGSKVRVLLKGDLAHNGRYQVLVLDPRAPVAGDPASGVAFWRAAVIQKEDKGWMEVLRCDEYLKNSSGYLRGTPLAPVSGWQLQVGPADDKRGQQLSFTPLPVKGIVSVPAIKVRWNPIVNRYQSLDAANQTFLAELPLLETPASELR